MQTQMPMYQWTIPKYHQMIEAGVLQPDDRVELLQGTLYRVSPKGIAHVIITRWIAEQLRECLGHRAYLLTQDPITLPALNSEPEPDIALVKGSWSDYLTHHPYPTDIDLVIEVVDSSLDYDKNIKIPIYAQAGIPEYWIVDVNAGEIIVCRQPTPENYASITVMNLGDSISPLAFSDINLQVSNLFPPSV